MGRYDRQLDEFEAGVELVASAENVVMTRTFSKIHGLGGLRIGWMFAPAHIVDAIKKANRRESARARS